LKTEFLIQLDGVGSSSTRILVIAATNRPYDLDEAALRRLTKRIYIGLPDSEARAGLIRKLMKQVDCSLSTYEFNQVVSWTEGYSSADLNSLCKEAAMEPIREIPPHKIMELRSASNVRKVSVGDF
jgi:SpoVK/Ycf46/Vps4 family AAA+-type ATPase